MNQTFSSVPNPLGTEKIGKLILKFSIPSVIGMLVNALYNIVDQIFIGQGIGILGNAATNVQFPLVTICTALALLIGVGSSARFNLALGAKDKTKASEMAGTGISLMVILGVSLAFLVLLFLNPLLHAFGATDTVFPYAIEYTRIVTLGMPFLIFSTASSNLIRADGSPTYSMLCILSGAVLNMILDPIFIFVFNMGMTGAALATVLGQFLSAFLAFRYFKKFKTLKLKKENFSLKPHNVKAIVSLGAASCFNQLSMTIVQIVMNNTLSYYGALSVYGSDIPLACVGVISKINILFLGIVIGIAQGCQPIHSFNYGAKNFKRVKKVYFSTLIAVTIISFSSFFIFQFFPREVVSIFGQGTEDYYIFAEGYFRIFMFMTFINGVQPITANFFTSIGKAQKGILLSLTRQILFLLPLILIFPRIWGIDGVMYAGPIADAAAGILAFFLVFKEMKAINAKIKAIEI